MQRSFGRLKFGWLLGAGCGSLEHAKRLIINVMIGCSNQSKSYNLDDNLCTSAVEWQHAKAANCVDKIRLWSLHP
ncbi:MAG: hypothetical protein ACI8PP_002864 [Candidatus Pseudothioglobus sp.]|jgi:hypothetical protein